MYSTGLAAASDAEGVDIQPIHTMGGDVVDTFYVTDATGEKVLDAEHQGEIRRALMHVLDPAG